MNLSFLIFPCFFFSTNFYVKHKDYDFYKTADRSAFRKTKTWMDFRKAKIEEQNNLDPITLKKLSRTANCHHMDLHRRNYDKLIPENFVVHNNKMHSLIHDLYDLYVKDPEVLDRIKDELDKMSELNHGMNSRQVFKR